MAIENIKSQQAEFLHRSSWERFDQWVNQSGAYQTLDIPQEVADVLIPKNILERSHNPQSVHVLRTEKDPKHIGFVVYEQQSEPLTDWDRLKKWKANHRPPILLPNSIEDSPEGVDYMHLRHEHNIEAGELSVNDMIYFQYSADVPTGYPHVVETRNYTDRKELQGQGIGTSFYNRWEEVVKRLGFKYLTGHIISVHPGFFQKNRVGYDHLPQEIKDELPDVYAHIVAGDKYNRNMIRIL